MKTNKSTERGVQSDHEEAYGLEGERNVHVSEVDVVRVEVAPREPRLTEEDALGEILQTPARERE